VSSVLNIKLLTFCNLIDSPLSWILRFRFSIQIQEPNWILVPANLNGNVRWQKLSFLHPDFTHIIGSCPLILKCGIQSKTPDATPVVSDLDFSSRKDQLVVWLRTSNFGASRGVEID
jgi:hypothetical protein